MTTRRIIEIDLTNDDEIPRITIRERPILGDITTATNQAAEWRERRRVLRERERERERQNLQNIPSLTQPRGRTVDANTPSRRRRNRGMEANKENQPPPTGSGLQKNEMESYCVKCKRKEAMLEPKEITTSNGRKAMSGKCAICGTKMMRFVKK